MSRIVLPSDIYQERMEFFKKKISEQSHIFAVISRVRLISIVAGGGIAGYLLSAHYVATALFIAIVSMFIFFAGVSQHVRLRRSQTRNRHCLDINSQSIERVTHGWMDFSGDGREFMDSAHPYAVDLDIFGKGSLFQWINVSRTYHGTLSLKQLLEHPEKNIPLVKKRQEAIIELAALIDWRQDFYAEGLCNAAAAEDPMPLVGWAENDAYVFSSKIFLFFIYLFPVLTLGSLVWMFFVPFLGRFFLIICVLVQLVFIAVYFKRLQQVIRFATRYKDVLETYQGLLHMIETQNFRSPYLQELKEGLIVGHNLSASRSIRKLDKIVDYMNARYSGLHFLINIVTLWDFHCVIACERWKRHSGARIARWLESIGSFEALSSLALICFDNPDWIFPEFTETSHVFSARGLGHPLLPPSTRVVNDITLKGSGSVALITGSNMSGKSTMLRTVGINLVLAYAGAPVCAAACKCSMMELYTSMRISDNLEKNISSFYAELLRIKMIIQAAYNGELILFLLDEVFRGTNSRDRRIGAEAVISTLSKTGAMGMVSTHDLELASLEERRDLQLENYYFKETYSDNRISFDYIMRKGVSTTSDALFLMKMIGIDLD